MNKIKIESKIKKKLNERKLRTLSQLGAEKIKFPSKPDGQTDLQTDGRTFGYNPLTFFFVQNFKFYYAFFNVHSCLLTYYV